MSTFMGRGFHILMILFAITVILTSYFNVFESGRGPLYMVVGFVIGAGAIYELRRGNQKGQS